jgi:hypothetical protein
MTTIALVRAAVTAAAFPLLLWAIGRGVTAVGERASYRLGRPRQYLAGRLYGVRIIAMVDGEDELLVSLATQAPGAAGPAGDPLAAVFRVTASECSLARVRRWRDEGTPLRAYLSQDGAIMLADPVLGGNAACEPSVTATRQARARAVSQDQRPPEDR